MILLCWILQFRRRLRGSKVSHSNCIPWPRRRTMYSFVRDAITNLLNILTAYTGLEIDDISVKRASYVGQIAENQSLGVTHHLLLS